jgi:phosphoribosylformylglycinamidine (FGAM) synthase PurS component
MPTKIVEMVVGLKVPDNTAITALQTLQKIGLNKINGVKREDYYKFFIEGDAEKFKKQVPKVDILVNANKHYHDFSVKKDGSVKILVKSSKIEDFRDPKNPKDFLGNINDNGGGILSTLKNRLGFKNITKIEKGTLWSLGIDSDDQEARKIADKAAKELLVNENYQEYRVL